MDDVVDSEKILRYSTGVIWLDAIRMFSGLSIYSLNLIGFVKQPLDPGLRQGVLYDNISINLYALSN